MTESKECCERCKDDASFNMIVKHSKTNFTGFACKRHIKFFIQRIISDDKMLEFEVIRI